MGVERSAGAELGERKGHAAGGAVASFVADVARLATKRALDLVLASLALALLAPLFLVVAVAIKLDSRGPVFFRQVRVGARWRIVDGRLEWEITPFRIFKFRSMRADADESLHREHIRAFVEGRSNGNGAEQGAKLRDDPRVTRVGAAIRRTSIDELPQLINVVRGEMSLVGPRPVPEYEVEGYRADQYERLTALPGITGMWQVYGRGRVTLEEMIRMDIEYARNQSLMLDLKLLARTIPAVLAGRGAG